MIEDLYVTNKICECDDGKPRSRKFETVDKLIVHRIGESLGSTGAQIAEAFRDTSRWAAGSYTGGQMPYHFVIRECGTVDQCLTLGDHAPHARRWNASGLAVAVIGDFRSIAPTPEQWDALKSFCGLWTLYGLKVYGHDELPGGSKDPSKACPGKMLNMNSLRIEAAAVAAELARDAIRLAGVSFQRG